MLALVDFLIELINIYIWIIIIAAIASWLVALEILNIRNMFIFKAYDVLVRLTEPAYRPIRKLLPDMGGIDISPLIIILGLSLLNSVLRGIGQ